MRCCCRIPHRLEFPLIKVDAQAGWRFICNECGQKRLIGGDRFFHSRLHYGCVDDE